MMKKLTFILLIVFTVSISVKAQNATIAKFKFEEAEEAYNSGKYQVALTKLDEVEKLLGKTFEKTLYLRIMASDKLIWSATGSPDVKKILLLQKNYTDYLKTFEGQTEEDKYRDIYKISEKYNENITVLKYFVNYYIQEGQLNEALINLRKLIEKEPLNAENVYVVGGIEENQGNFDKSIAAYTKATELNPKYSDAYLAIGRLYYNKAVKMTEDANNIKDIDQYRAVKKNIDSIFVKSIPFFKKALEIKPSELDCLIPLKNMYYKLNMMDEYAIIEKQIKDLSNE